MGTLTKRRILITRPDGRGSRLADLLAADGAETILIPTIELRPPASFCALDAGLTGLRDFDWLLFTSAAAVEVYAERARRLGLSPVPRRVAAIGAATAEAVAAAGIATQVDLVPAKAVAECLAEALRAYAAGASMLLVRAAVARDVLPERLTAAGATVTIADAYRTVVAEDSVKQLQCLFADAQALPVDAITFTSASTATSLATLLGAAGVALPEGVVLASIGPITSQAMRELGWEPTVEAGEASLSSLVEALRKTL